MRYILLLSAALTLSCFIACNKVDAEASPEEEKPIVQEHVHSFKQTVIPGNCIFPDELELVCEVCGFTDRIAIEGSPLRECNPEDLVYHETVEPTEAGFGRVAHYQCTLCGKMYADALGKEDITDNAVLLPLATDEMVALYQYANGITSPVPGLVEAVIGFLVNTIPSIAFWLPQFVKSDLKKFTDAKKKIDAISSKLDDVARQVNNIAMEVQNIAYNVKIQQRFEEQNSLNLLMAATLNAISMVNDKAISDAEKEAELRKILIDWGNQNIKGKKTAPDITLGLMLDYPSSSTGPNVPEMYGEIISTKCIWEHQGYRLREWVMLRDAVTVGLSYLLTMLYNENVRTYTSNMMKKEHAELMKSAYDDYIKTIEKEKKRMQERDGKYRRYMPDNTTYRKAINEFGFFNFLDDSYKRYFPRNNKDGIAEHNCEEMLKRNGYYNSPYDRFMSEKVAQEIRVWYNQQYGKNFNVLDLLADSLGFSGCSQELRSKGKWVMIMDNAKGFGHTGDDIAYPTYKIFKWRSYKGSTDNDWFAVYPCLKSDATVEQVYLMENCNVQVDDGYINNMGTQHRDRFYSSILVAQ